MVYFRILITGLLGFLLSSVVLAQNYPTKSVRFMVGFAAGGAADITARILAQKLSELWGQTVIVDNRPGASGIIGAETVAKAAPDGYILLISPQTSTATAASYYPKLPYDVLRDFTIITVATSSPLILVLHPSLPPHSFHEFISFAKVNFKSLSFGSGGRGSGPHLAGELLNLALNIKMTHIPYKGENLAAIDTIGGQMPLMLPTLPVGLPHVKTGKLRGIAVTSLHRSTSAPEYPSIAESGIPGFESAPWIAMYAPAALPPSIVSKLNTDVVRALQFPDVLDRLVQQGIDRVGNSQEQASAYLRAEMTKWAQVIKNANLHAD
jgi:hypothetical protein